MKFKTVSKKVAGTYTRDGKTIPVKRTELARVPKLPRNWNTIALGTAVTTVCLLTVLSVVWSTISIGAILNGGIGYAVAVVFDIAWGVSLLLEFLSRYDEKKRAFPEKLGWILLACTMGAIAWHGYSLGSIPMAVVGASVSAFAKVLWLGVMKHVNADLSEEDKQWVASEMSAAQAKAAIASVRRQAAKTEQRAALELLAMEKERRDIAEAFGLETQETSGKLPEVEAPAPAVLEGPSFSEINKADAIRIAYNQHPEMSHAELVELLAEHDVDTNTDYVRQTLKRKKPELEPTAEIIELRK